MSADSNNPSLSMDDRYLTQSSCCLW